MCFVPRRVFTNVFLSHFFMFMPFVDNMLYKGVFFLSFFTILIFTCVVCPNRISDFPLLISIKRYFLRYSTRQIFVSACKCNVFYDIHLLKPPPGIYLYRTHPSRIVADTNQRSILFLWLLYGHLSEIGFHLIRLCFLRERRGIKVGFKTMVCHQNRTCWCFNTRNIYHVVCKRRELIPT